MLYDLPNKILADFPIENRSPDRHVDRLFQHRVHNGLTSSNRCPCLSSITHGTRFGILTQVDMCTRSWYRLVSNVARSSHRHVYRSCVKLACRNIMLLTLMRIGFRIDLCNRLLIDLHHHIDLVVWTSWNCVMSACNVMRVGLRIAICSRLPMDMSNCLWIVMDCLYVCIWLVQLSDP